MRNADRKRAAQATYRRRHRMKLREDSRRRNRGPLYWLRREKNWQIAGITFNGKPLTAAVFRECIRLQGDACAVTGIKDAWVILQADHNHITGEFRGALCADVNRKALGTFEKFGTWKSEHHELALRSYLLCPPAVRFYTELTAVQRKEKKK